MMKYAIAMLMVILGLAGPSWAGTAWYDQSGAGATNDLWSNGANWNNGTGPLSGVDDVMLYPNAGAGGLCQMDSSSVILGLGFAGASPIELEFLPAGDLVWTNQSWPGFGMGTSKTNILTMNGGSLEVNTMGSWLVFGDYGVGILNMNDGLLKTDQLRIDFDRAGASGQVYMTGGTIDLSGYLRIGANGRFNYSDGEVIVRDKDDRAVLGSYINNGQITGSPTAVYDGTNTYLQFVPTARWFDHSGSTGNNLWSDYGNWYGSMPSATGLDWVNLYPNNGAATGGVCQVDTSAYISSLTITGTGSVIELEILPTGSLTWSTNQTWPTFGNQADKTHILTVNGGTFDIKTEQWLAFGDAGTGILNMNDGLLKTHNLRIDWDKGTNRRGEAYMTGGVIDLTGILRVGVNGLLDMTGGMIITRGTDDTSMLQWMIDQGLITGGPTLSYDGTNTYLYHNPVLTYETWIADYNLTGDDALRSADIENGGVGDGMDNLLEYVLGGNPTNDDAASILPTVDFDASSIEYVFRRRRDADYRGLVYDVVLNTNGLQQSWDNVGDTYEMFSGVIDDDFESVTNTIPTTGIDVGFVNLEVTEN